MTRSAAGGVEGGRAGRTYLAQQVKETLAQDPRVGELDLHVRVDDDLVMVTGHVTTPERKRAVAMIIAELVPGVEVRNDVTVVATDQPPIEERLA